MNKLIDNSQRFCHQLELTKESHHKKTEKNFLFCFCFCSFFYLA